MGRVYSAVRAAKRRIRDPRGNRAHLRRAVRAARGGGRARCPGECRWLRRVRHAATMSDSASRPGIAVFNPASPATPRAGASPGKACRSGWTAFSEQINVTDAGRQRRLAKEKVFLRRMVHKAIAGEPALHGARRQIWREARPAGGSSRGAWFHFSRRRAPQPVLFVADDSG